jgi:hypothetical protein
MSRKNRAARPTRLRTALGLPRRRRAAPPAPADSAAAKQQPGRPLGRDEHAARPAHAPAPPSHEEIARRAYELHRSGAEGDALAHWLAAERELVAN